VKPKEFTEMGGSLGRQNLFENKILFWLCVLVNLYGNFDSFSVRASTQQMSTVQELMRILRTMQ